MNFLKTADDMRGLGFELTEKQLDLSSQATRFANEAEDALRAQGKPSAELLPRITPGDALRGLKHVVTAWTKAQP